MSLFEIWKTSHWVNLTQRCINKLYLTRSKRHHLTAGVILKQYFFIKFNLIYRTLLCHQNPPPHTDDHCCCYMQIKIFFFFPASEDLNKPLRHLLHHCLSSEPHLQLKQMKWRQIMCFGIQLLKRAVSYPGIAAPVNGWWIMYSGILWILFGPFLENKKTDLSTLHIHFWGLQWQCIGLAYNRGSKFMAAALIQLNLNLIFNMSCKLNSCWNARVSTFWQTRLLQNSRHLDCNFWDASYSSLKRRYQDFWFLNSCQSWTEGLEPTLNLYS